MTTVVTVVARLFVSAASLGIAIWAGMTAVAGFTGVPDNTQSANIEIGIVASVVCLAAVGALVAMWRKP